MSESCPCGRGPALAECCGPLLSGERAAQTAEQLMRSRYSAYALGDIDYLVATHDPATLDTFDRASAGRLAGRSRFAGLDVRSVERGGADDDEGIVEFVASYSVSGELRAHRERSRFRRADGRWLYVDALPTPRAKPARAGAKIGRNDKCPCGSGKKYKRCCGR